MSPTRAALPDLPQARWIADRIVAGDAEATVRVNDAEDVVNALRLGSANRSYWALADRYPQRIASLTVLSRPHPNAFNRALEIDDAQAHRSRHHKAFLEPDAADVVLADGAKWLRDRLAANGVPAAAVQEHLSVLGNKDAMEGALAWYRARGAIRGPLGPIHVPTLFIWGDADDTVGRIAAESTRDFIAAPYRFEVLPGVGHFATDQAPDRVNALMLPHIAAYPL